jgi:hypothetical protein
MPFLALLACRRLFATRRSRASANTDQLMNPTPVVKWCAMRRSTTGGRSSLRHRLQREHGHAQPLPASCASSCSMASQSRSFMPLDPRHMPLSLFLQEWFNVLQSQVVPFARRDGVVVGVHGHIAAVMASIPCPGSVLTECKALRLRLAAVSGLPVACLQSL